MTELPCDTNSLQLHNHHKHLWGEQRDWDGMLWFPWHGFSRL